jgi:hypothetical protein
VPIPYEEPRKTELRTHALAAIESAGYEPLPEPVAIPLPGSDLQGGILGDIQALDGDGRTHAYYVRPEGDKPVPQWLANYAIASHDLPDVRVFVVVEESSAELERSCRGCGAGLLRVDVETHSIEVLVGPDEFDRSRLDAAFKEAVKTVRRRMETRLQLNQDKISDDFAAVDKITADMDPDERDAYIGKIEQRAMEWRDWSDSISERLDAVYMANDPDELALIERDVGRGPSGSSG